VFTIVSCIYIWLLALSKKANVSKKTQHRHAVYEHTQQREVRVIPPLAKRGKKELWGSEGIYNEIRPGRVAGSIVSRIGNREWVVIGEKQKMKVGPP
jgi:hypothetical protein